MLHLTCAALLSISTVDGASGGDDTPNPVWDALTVMMSDLKAQRQMTSEWQKRQYDLTVQS